MRSKHEIMKDVECGNISTEERCGIEVFIDIRDQLCSLVNIMKEKGETNEKNISGWIRGSHTSSQEKDSREDKGGMAGKN